MDQKQKLYDNIISEIDKLVKKKISKHGFCVLTEKVIAMTSEYIIKEFEDSIKDTTNLNKEEQAVVGAIRNNPFLLELFKTHIGENKLYLNYNCPKQLVNIEKQNGISEFLQTIDTSELTKLLLKLNSSTKS